MALCCPLKITTMFFKETIFVVFFILYYKSFIDQSYSAKDSWTLSSYWSTPFWSKNTKKKIKVRTRPVSSHLDRTIVVSNPYMFFSVEMCYEASKNAKKKYFAIQFFGECWVSDTESYKVHGPSTNCWNGVGRDYDNYVYEALW